MESTLYLRVKFPSSLKIDFLCHPLNYFLWKFLYLYPVLELKEEETEEEGMKGQEWT